MDMTALLIVFFPLEQMQLALQKKEDALETLDRALRLEPTNALCKFQRARVLTSCGAHQDALVELEQLKQLVPKESMVYYLTGKVIVSFFNV